ncbi:peptidylprolyl isomerase [Oleisolibacter albus]|uniref:peptidylprolyl isomerase n=1 Tax=Oleisolibacter albus TaxID=2171757 RepID=UPI000DF47F81|nr:peptidylprolyl isomerase [Oleisolibacter albus]
MLQSLRSTAGSWVVKILFLVLIVSFAIWGIGDITRGVQGGVAEVGSVKLTPQDLDREFRSEMNRLRRMLGPDFTEAQARQLGLVDRALEQMIQRTLISLAAKDLGVRIPDAQVVAEARTFPAFQNGLGQFDVNVMRAVLAQNGLTEQTFVEQMREDLSRNLIAGAVTNGTATPLPLAQALYRYRNEKRVFDIVAVPAASMPAPAAPDEAALIQFHQDKAVRYTLPEYRTVQVATLTADDLLPGVSVTDEELHQAYDARSSEFVTKEHRTLVQAVFPDEAAATKAADAVKGGKTIDAAAKAAKIDAAPLEGVTREDLPAELQEPVFAAAQGGLVGPVKTDFGWHVVTVTGISPGGEQSFEQVKDMLAQQLRREKATDQLFDVANKMDEAIAAGTPLADVSKEFGAKSLRLEKVDAQGRTAAGTPVQGVDQPVIETAFSLQEGQTSPMTESASGQGYYVVHVDEVQPAALSPLDSVRAKVLADWTAEQRQQAAKAKAEEIAAAIRGGTTPADAAKAVPGATLSRTEPLLRSAGRNNAVLPPATLEELFAAAPGAVAVGDMPTGQIVARLIEVVAADPAADAAGVEQIRTTTSETIAGDLLAEYVDGLRARYGVKINRTLIDSMYRTQE